MANTDSRWPRRRENHPYQFRRASAGWSFLRGPWAPLAGLRSGLDRSPQSGRRVIGGYRQRRTTAGWRETYRHTP